MLQSVTVTPLKEATFMYDVLKVPSCVLVPKSAFLFYFLKLFFGRLQVKRIYLAIKRCSTEFFFSSTCLVLDFHMHVSFHSAIKIQEQQ